MSVYNWSSQEQKDKKILRSDKYRIWQLEQSINFGLNGEKLEKKELKKYWSQLALDPNKKLLLSHLLWNKAS